MDNEFYEFAIRAQLRWSTPLPPGLAYRAFFLSQVRSHRCVHCWVPCRYRHELLQKRICEDCEHALPRYDLITRMEAVERYGLSAPQLEGLRSLERYDMQLWMRGDVERIAAAPTEEEDEEEEAEDAGSEEAGPSGSNDIFDLDEETRVEQNREHQRRLREESRAARKANKQVAKEGKREKRSGGAGGTSPGPESLFAAMTIKPAAKGAHLKKSAVQADSPLGSSPSTGRSFPPRRRAQAEFRREGAAAAYPGGVSSKELARGVPREEARQNLHANLTAMAAAQKTRSWILEREAIHREYGMYGLTALVLSTD